MESLHEEFQQYADQHQSRLDEVSKLWAVWVLSAVVEMDHPKDVLWDEEPDKEEYTEEEREVIRYCLTTENLDYHELYKRFHAIGSVDGIFTLGWNTFAWMYGMGFVDPDHIDEVLEETQKCDDCYDSICLHGFIYAISDKPYTMDQCSTLVHCGHDIVDKTVQIIAEYRVDTLVHLYTNYKVSRVDG